MAIMKKLFVAPFIVFLSLVSTPSFATDPEPAPTMSLKPFMSDGCTGFIGGPPGKGDLWEHCCFEHDLRYWFGGDDIEMKFADKSLKACVKEVAGSTWARIIYNGVRAGHSSPIKAKTHWSWGWETPRGKSALTENEISYVESELRKLDLEPAYVDSFVDKYLRRH